MIGVRHRIRRWSDRTALVHDPQLLLLDEPTAGLDPKGREAMLALLKAIASRHGKPRILSTHLLGDIDRVCEQVIIVNRGRAWGGFLTCDSTGRTGIGWAGAAPETVCWRDCAKLA